MLRLIQLTFGGSTLTKEQTWETMVLLPKGKAEYQVISIVELMWKVCTSVVNFRLKWGVRLHNAIHGYREEQGMGTADLEGNLV